MAIWPFGYGFRSKAWDESKWRQGNMLGRWTFWIYRFKCHSCIDNIYIYIIYYIRYDNMYIYIYVYPICSGLYKKSLCPFVVSTYFDARQRCCTFRTLPRVLASAESGGTSAQLYNVVHTNYPFDIVWYCLIDYRVYTYTKFIADDDWWRSTIGISGYLFTINYTKEQMHIQYRFSHSLLVLAWVQRVHFRWRVEFAAMWMRSEGRVPEAITEWASHWTTCLKYRLQAIGFRHLHLWRSLKLGQERHHWAL